MKTTAIAPSNIAFIKYWGRKNDPSLRLPENGSISMNLSNLHTTTTVAFDASLANDDIACNGEKEEQAVQRIVDHLDRIRKIANVTTKAKVVTENNFPTGTGLSSSASGFAALTVAGVNALGLMLSEKELSILARLGSGSACRSIPDGFVEWLPGDSNETSYAVSLYEPSYWNIIDIVVVTGNQKKDISSSAGHALAQSSPFFDARLRFMEKKITHCKQYLAEKNFTKFGELLEAEALELHAIYLTSTPSLIYLLPESLRVMQKVKEWRQNGIPVYFTLNTGQDIHLICPGEYEKKVVNLIHKETTIQKTIVNKPAIGTRLVNTHLF